jgi:tripartite-type tricarboxylate transporter receptor subunit TctC
MELLKGLRGLEIKHVPYRVRNAAVNDLVGSHLDMFVGSLPQMIELVRSGSAIGIAVTRPQRPVAVAEIPTIEESGVPGYELEQWWGIVAPARTPRDIIDTLNAELNRILATPEIKSFMAHEGADPTPSTPEAFARHLSDELQRWTALADRTGLKVR